MLALAPTSPPENALMDEYHKTLMSAVDAACRGDLQALLIARWMLGALRFRMGAACSDDGVPPTQ